MKTIYTIVALILCSMSLSAQSFDLKEALKGLASKNDTTNTDKGSAGSAIGSILGNVLGKSDVTPADLEGTWNYTAPAVTFKSENLLKKAGGAAASATIENKIKPYYQRAGLENLVLTVANDSTFTMKLKRGSLSGSIAQGTEKGILVFKFKAAGKINIGSMNTTVSLAGNQLTLTFDISKLMTIVDRLASLSGNSTLGSINSMLQSYDGLQALFKLKKAQ